MPQPSSSSIPPGTPSGTATATAAASGGDLASRGCNTPGCTVSTIVEKTKRKCSQFVSAPYVMPKPVLVNGHTSIFQIGGEMAKMVDIPSLSKASGGDGGKPIYRIKPGTHAHVINFVLVDEGSDSMDKAASGDQNAMRMVIDSQRESAISKLNKIIASHLGATAGKPNPAGPSGLHVSTPQIHPDFSIASVEGAVSFAGGTARAAAPTVATAPAPVATAAAAAVASQQVSALNVGRLQAEVNQLRRTVALLEETPRR